MIAESNDITNVILTRINLIEVMYQASQNQACSSKVLGALVWLAGQIIRTNQTDGENVLGL